MKTKEVSQLFAITTNTFGFVFVLIAIALFVKFGFIVGGAFIFMFGSCLILVSILWLIIEYKREGKIKHGNIKRRSKSIHRTAN